MKTFEEYWEETHPLYDAGNDTIGEYHSAKQSWENGQIAAFRYIVDWYGPDNYDMADLINHIHRNFLK